MARPRVFKTANTVHTPPVREFTPFHAAPNVATIDSFVKSCLLFREKKSWQNFLGAIIRPKSYTTAIKKITLNCEFNRYLKTDEELATQVVTS